MILQFHYTFNKIEKNKILKKILYTNLNNKISMNLIELTTAQLINLNAFLGSKKNEWNDLISIYFLGIRYNYIILNLEFSRIQLKLALNLIFNISGNPTSLILVVGNFYKQEIMLNKLFNKLNHAFFNSNWIAGILNNYKEFSKFIFKKKYSKYIQKKLILIIKKRQKFLSSITNLFKLRKIPNIVFSLRLNNLVINECILLKIPTISLYDGNSFLLKKVDYPIISNDNSIYNISLYSRLIKYSIILGKLKYLKKIFYFYKNIKYFTKILLNFIKSNLISVAGFEPALRRSKF